MIHYWARIHVVVPNDVEAASDKVKEMSTRRGGFALSVRFDGESSANLDIKVASEELDAALEELASLGRVESRSVSGRDITEEYADVDARLGAMRATRDRLRTLYERANTVEEVIAVERELGRVQSELESLEARMRVLAQQRDLADIDVTITRERVLGPLGLVVHAVGWTLEKLFILRE